MRVLSSSFRASCRWRCIHSTSTRAAITNLMMPAMSPTMTEGSISHWKKKEGESFVAGDVLLEIETDKTAAEVEAPFDGVMGKILLADDTKRVSVGRIIALLAEEGDDISNLPIPEEGPPSPPPSQNNKEPAPPEPAPPALPASRTPIQHSQPLFPSVHRLLLMHHISDPSKIKGTGVRGMLTRGDVLAYLGQASGPMGTWKGPKAEERVLKWDERATKKSESQKEVPALDGPSIRRLIVANLSKPLVHSPPAPPPTFDTIIADYLPLIQSSEPAPHTPKTKSEDYLHGLI